MLLFIDLNDCNGMCDVLHLLSLFLFFAMSGYVLNIVISNEKKKPSKRLFSKKVDFFFNDRFSPFNVCIVKCTYFVH